MDPEAIGLWIHRFYEFHRIICVLYISTLLLLARGNIPVEGAWLICAEVHDASVLTYGLLGMIDGVKMKR